MTRPINDPPRDDQPRLSARLILAVWSVPAVLSTVETVVFSRMGPRPLSPWQAFVAEAPGWYTWALLTPVVVMLGQRFPLDRARRLTSIAVHLLASIVAGITVALVNSGVNAIVRPRPVPLVVSFTQWFLSGLPATTIAYFAILGASYALLNSARLRAREQHAERLASQLAQAQLSALRTQLQPHFLFNSLNAIMALVRGGETDGAIRALALLSDLLRTTLRAEFTHEVPLAEELALIAAYLEIEQVRFSDRLRVAVNVPDALRNAAVPTFVLQPLVENAVRHGIMNQRNGGCVDVSARATDHTLELIVRDDGRGLATDWEDRATRGVGLSNTRARLARMYDDRAQLSIKNAADHGVIVTVTLPLRQIVPVPNATPRSETAAPAAV